MPEFNDADFPADGSHPPGWDQWSGGKRRRWDSERDRRRRDADDRARRDGGDRARNVARAAGMAVDQMKDGVRAVASAAVDALVPQKRQFAALEARLYRTYLRLGDRPLPGDPATPPGEEYNKDLLDHWAGGSTPSDADSADSGWPDMAKGFIHHSATRSPHDLLEDSTWVDHASGDRVTTTEGNKVEIIKGNYKLVTCDGQSGIDFSGGHLQSWAKTPGYISQVSADGSEVTETVVADTAYHYRFWGGSYAEHFSCNRFEARFGVATTKPMGGFPPPKENPPHRALELYYEEIEAKVIEEKFVTTERHDEMVSAKDMTESREASGDVTVEVKVGGTAKETCDANEILDVDVAKTSIRDESTVGATKALEELAPTHHLDQAECGVAKNFTKVQAAEIVESSTIGGGASTTTTSPSGVRTSLSGAAVTSFTLGGNVYDQVFAAAREQLSICAVGSLSVQASIGPHIETTSAPMVMDTIVAATRVEVVQAATLRTNTLPVAETKPLQLQVAGFTIIS
ncbi:MAG: hypothetical protein AAF928_05655 [Myxococcota bacterium]